jgi:muramoyltetrapeptide carboxypeptidase
MPLNMFGHTQPPFLAKGDTVALIATARKIEIDQLNLATSTLKSWGLNVITGHHLLDAHHQFAGSDHERAADVQQALNNESVKAIICFRGGYGSVRLLEKLNLSTLQRNPKWIVGYSDVTALHNVWQNAGIMCVHGTMPVNFSSNSGPALESLRKALFGEKNTYSFSHHALNRTGSTQGLLTGGNLSMLLSLAGTKHDIDTRGKILILEDLDEYLYHIDRMMWNLKLADKLTHLKGLIVGGFTDMKDNAVPFGQTAYEIIAEAVADYNYPVVFDFPFGHIPDNRALILGKEAVLNVLENNVVFAQ